MAYIITVMIQDAAVTTPKIADLNVTEDKLATNSVSTGKVVDLGVTTAKLANDSVTSAKIAPNTIVAGDIAMNTITATEIAADTITAAELAPNSVGASELADNAVDSGAIQVAAVTNGKLATDAVATANILDGNVTQGKLAKPSVGGPELLDNAVDSQHYTDGSIDSEHLSQDAIDGVLNDLIRLVYYRTTAFTASSSASDDVTQKVFVGATNKRVDGSESVQGIVTTAPDNRCQVRLQGTNNAVEDPQDRDVFGRLTKTDTSLSGVVTFINGSPNVSGDPSTLFLTELAINDWIKSDTDGVYYRIQSITDNQNLVLYSNYNEVGGAGVATETKFTLNYLIEDASDVEQAHTMGGEVIDIMFPEALSLKMMPFNALITGVGFTEAMSGTHIHDDRYYTETELGSSAGTTGASLIGVDPASIAGTSATNLQSLLEDSIFRPVLEVIAVTAPNTLAPLSYTPKDNMVLLFWFGLGQDPSSDYSVSGTTITWVGPPNISPGQLVYVWYLTNQ